MCWLQRWLGRWFILAARLFPGFFSLHAVQLGKEANPLFSSPSPSLPFLFSPSSLLPPFLPSLPPLYYYWCYMYTHPHAPEILRQSCLQKLLSSLPPLLSLLLPLTVRWGRESPHQYQWSTAVHPNNTLLLPLPWCESVCLSVCQCSLNCHLTHFQ